LEIAEPPVFGASSGGSRLYSREVGEALIDDPIPSAHLFHPGSGVAGAWC